MLFDNTSKVSARHLQRKAILYIRQSTVQQIREHQEGLARQYAFQNAALKLGWREDQIEIIDCDLGRSGTSAENREGFQKLVGEVSLGRVGLVMALEASRLARKCSDWHRLAESCASRWTLLMDEDGLYDPAEVNDKMILGMKGMMSEIEIHLLQVRMKGALLNKARRGELKKPLPVGFVYDEADVVRLDPDDRVRETIQLFFETYRRIGSVFGTVKYFCKQGILFPWRPLEGPRTQPVSWDGLKFTHARRILVNPAYAGVYAYGRQRTSQGADGRRKIEPRPREEWIAFIKDAHEGYISFEEFELNQKRLAQNNTRQGAATVREGAALLQGLAICGYCGGRMAIHYHKRKKGSTPSYLCQRNEPTDRTRGCQSMVSRDVDEAVSALVLEVVSPLALEVSLAVRAEIEAQAERIDQLRRRRVEQARYEAELARRRYMSVDPDNRLVASSLEAAWNEKLKSLEEAKKAYEWQSREDAVLLDEKKKAEIMTLANDFPKLWNNPATPMRERKRLLRLLIEDVTLKKGDDEIDVHIRFRGGATRSLIAPAPQLFGQTNVTPAEAVAQIDRLLESHCEDEVVKILNGMGMKSGTGKIFDIALLADIRRRHGIKTYFERLRKKGMLTSNELAGVIGVTPDTVRKWRRRGILHGVKARANGRCLYDHPDEETIAELRKRKVAN